MKKIDIIHEKCIEDVEEHFMSCITVAVLEDRIEDSTAIHDEFVVDGVDTPEDWLFINDLTLEDL
tara:strand:- start:188 stop:382 length:195 start_codon:yes stop_codon:yes gene_type:complete